MNCGGRNESDVRVRWVVTASVVMTTTIASQNQRKTLRKRLRKLPYRTISNSTDSGVRGRTRGRARVDVADAAHGLDPFGLTGAVAELLAEVADVHVDAAVEDRQLAPEHLAHELFALDDEPGGAEQQDENLVLGVRQLDGPALAPDLPRALVHPHVSDAQARGLARVRRLRGGLRACWARAPQDGLYARDQLARVEGLGQVVVGADLQPDDAVNVVAARREHHDVHVRPFGPQPPQHLEAVHARHHHVEHDERVLARERALQPRLAPVRDLDGEALFAQKLGHQLAQLAVVVNNQHVFHPLKTPRTF